uniref:Uncharacterized protein n=1 Tax=Physcomitrium patens TaxID=3218 RepID=A0A7I4EM53_PHYPA
MHGSRECFFVDVRGSRRTHRARNLSMLLAQILAELQVFWDHQACRCLSRWCGKLDGTKLAAEGDTWSLIRQEAMIFRGRIREADVLEQFGNSNVHMGITKRRILHSRGCTSNHTSKPKLGFACTGFRKLRFSSASGSV